VQVRPSGYIPPGGVVRFTEFCISGSGTVQTLFNFCDRVSRMPDAFAPPRVRGNDGPGLQPRLGRLPFVRPPQLVASFISGQTNNLVAGFESGSGLSRPVPIIRTRRDEAARFTSAGFSLALLRAAQC
jgi:hypothetical protein